MRALKKILKFTGISLVLLVILVIVFRDQIAIGMIKRDMSKKANRPYTMSHIPKLNDSIYQELASAFENHWMSPSDYLIDEFSKHDIILLGENHRINRDYRFVASMIPDLHKNGIYCLGLEFSLNQDSIIIQELLTDKEKFDKDKACDILFNFSPIMGYQEVLDIYMAAWKFNNRLDSGERPFMIHGIMHPTDFSILKTDAEKENNDIMNKVRLGVEDPEKFMADCILNDFADNNKKALVLCGMHHAFTGYEGHGDRTGVLVRKEIGDRVITVSLHYPWPGSDGFLSPGVYPSNGAIDAFIRRFSDKNSQFGISVKDNAFGELSDTTSYYVEDTDLKLDEFCDGYIYLGPFSEITSVKSIKRFITRKNVDRARSQLPNPEIRDGFLKFMGPPTFNALIGIDSDLEIRFRHLE